MSPNALAPEALGNLPELKRGGELEKALAARIEAIHKEELAKPAVDLRAGLTLAKADTHPNLHDVLASWKPNTPPPKRIKPEECGKWSGRHGEELRSGRLGRP